MEYHYITYPKKGEPSSGDSVFVLHEPQYTRFLVIDALGRGIKASRVISKVESKINTIRELPLVETIDIIEEILKDTCGANIAVIDFYTLKVNYGCLGDIAIKSNSDMMDKEVHKKAIEHNTNPDDVFIAHTRGISGDFDLDEGLIDFSAEDIARSIMKNYRKDTEDSTVLVVKLV